MTNEESDSFFGGTESVLITAFRKTIIRNKEVAPFFTPKFFYKNGNNQWEALTMKKIDIKSLIIGVLGTTLFFALVGAKSNDNIGDIVVSSLTVLDKNGGKAVVLGSWNDGGLFVIVDKAGSKAASLAAEDGHGVLRTYYTNVPAVVVGKGVDGGGGVAIFNKAGVGVGAFGSAEDGNGMLTTANTTGAASVFAGTGGNGNGALSIYNNGVLATYNKTGDMEGSLAATEKGGFLSIYNMHNKAVVSMMAGPDSEGVLILNNRIVDLGTP
ncbi:MAG: hypothetical protein HZA01_16180 [Nitrospinae bacterium]|nr:hypothetical protein [Nitrospinota bacterium]